MHASLSQLWGVVANSPGRRSLARVHPRFEVVPALPCDLLVRLRHLPCVLAEHMQKHHEIPRSPVKDPVEHAAVMTTQLPKFTLNLRAVRERQMWVLRREEVDPLDLVVNRDLMRGRKRLDEVIRRLRPVRGSVVLRLKMRRHASRLRRPAAGSARPSRRSGPSSAHSRESARSSRSWAWSTAPPASTTPPRSSTGCSDLLVEVFGEEAAAMRGQPSGWRSFRSASRSRSS